MVSNPGGGKSPFDIDPRDMFARMNMPFMPDMEALSTAQRRNMEALTAINKASMEAAQGIARRSFEIMQQTMADLSEGMRVMANPEPPEIKVRRQAEMVMKAYEHATANMQELGEMIQHSSAEAVNVLNTRFAEAVEEVKSLTKAAKPAS